MTPLDHIREQIKKKLDERKVSQDAIDDLLTKVQERGDDAKLSDDENKLFQAYREAIQDNDTARADLEATERDMQANLDARQAAEDAQRRYAGSTAPVPARITSEPEIYTRNGDYSFLHDAIARQTDPEAAERIRRNQAMGRARLQAEGRDVGVSAFGALVVPQYLTGDFAEVVRAGRPFLNTITSRDLPEEGMTLNIPRGTTGTAVLQQTTENSAIQEVDFDETTLAVPVCTYAGQQDVSRQAFDRGRNVDGIIMSDLAADYATRVNFDAIQGTGTNNRHLGILATTNGVTTVTFSGTTTALSSASSLHSKVADAIQRVNSTRYAAPTVIFMHPRRWGWLTAATDTSGRPLVVPNQQAPQNAIGVGQAAEYGQLVGVMLGLPVVTDASIPTTTSSSTISGSTEDVVIVTRAPDVYIFEDSPGPALVEFRETLAGSLSVKIVAWGYSAFTAGRYPSATAIVSGSSLTTPTF